MTTNDTPTAAQPYAKVYFDRCDVAIRDFINVFHAWVKDRRTGELLIDVHDYSHVHDGPGVILVGHEAHYGVDRREGRLGLVFRARRSDAAPVADELARATRRALEACQHLAKDLDGKIAFDTAELLVGFEDRLNAPNDDETHARLGDAVGDFVKRLWGDGGKHERTGEPRDLFGAKVSGPASSLSDLLAKLGG